MLMNPDNFSKEKKEAFNRYEKLLFDLSEFDKNDLSVERQILERRTRDAWERFLKTK